MPLYTFYHCKPDGSAASFETAHLPDDLSASVRARDILAEHLSCAYVTVWAGEEKLEERHRAAPPPFAEDGTSAIQ
jgi:hypothetical protein